MVDLGDIGDEMDRTPDGHDDYAIRYAPYQVGSTVHQRAIIYLFSGRTGLPIGSILDPNLVSWQNWGSVMAGGLDILGSGGVPDLVVGTIGDERVIVYELETISMFGANSVVIQATPYGGPTDPGTQGFFGFSVALIGDLTRDGKSEILVGAPQSTFNPMLNNSTGRAFILDANAPGLDPPYVWTNIEPEDSSGQEFFRFGWSVAVLGNIWPPPGYTSDGFPEVCISDPYYPVLGGFSDDRGYYGIYSYNQVLPSPPDYGALQSANAPTIPLQVVEGTGTGQKRGWWLAPLGDGDQALGGSGEWDVLVSHAFPSYTTHALAVRGLAPPTGTAYDMREWLLAGYPNKQLFAESYLLYLRTQTPQIVGIGDVDLDGADDFLVAQVPPGCAISQNPVAGLFALYSGANPVNPTPLWDLAFLQGRRLWGTVPEAAYPLPPQRQFVADLGDVDGDGFEDFGIVSGMDTGFIGSDCSIPRTSDLTLAMIFGTTVIPQPTLPPPQTAVPQLGGNVVAQVGRYVALQVSNLSVGQQVYVYEWTSLNPPRDPYACGGSLVVYDPSQPSVWHYDAGTADSAGEVTVILPLTYDRTLIGSKCYYQVYATGPGGCSYSNPSEVTLIDLSHPRWRLNQCLCA